MSDLVRALHRVVAALRAEKPTRPMSLRISDGLHASLSAIAEKERISLHALVIRTLEDRAWGALPTGMFLDSQLEGHRDAVSQRNAEGGRW